MDGRSTNARTVIPAGDDAIRVVWTNCSVAAAR
jgi:hypothetical protein